MIFKLQVYMNTPAFEDQPATELAEILRDLADTIEMGAAEADVIRDSNDTECGFWRMQGEPGRDEHE